MRRNYGPSFINSGAYTSPGTPEYGDINYVEDMPKTWSSERAALPTGSSWRHISAAALTPFNSGRALPSKWDDAERWITSPISGYGAFKSSIGPQTHQRRPKSKSGPLGLTSPVCLLSNYSPLTTGVLVPDGCLSVGYGVGIGVTKSSSLYGEDNNNNNNSNNNNRTTITREPEPEPEPEPDFSSSQADKLDDTNEEEAQVSRRDMATQMSSEGSTNSSSRGRLSFSNLPHTERVHGNKDDVRDVQVDKGTTTSMHPEKQGVNIEDLRSDWDIREASKNLSKLQREEAKINAWENLQTAKAEAAIRKLEMKLEKKRSAAIDKIRNKLRAAHTKAQAMRDMLSDQAPRDSHKGFSFCIYVRICNCSMCN